MGIKIVKYEESDEEIVHKTKTIKGVKTLHRQNLLRAVWSTTRYSGEDIRRLNKERPINGRRFKVSRPEAD